MKKVNVLFVLGFVAMFFAISVNAQNTQAIGYFSVKTDSAKNFVDVKTNNPDWILDYSWSGERYSISLGMDTTIRTPQQAPSVYGEMKVFHFQRVSERAEVLVGIASTTDVVRLAGGGRIYTAWVFMPEQLQSIGANTAEQVVEMLQRDEVLFNPANGMLAVRNQPVVQKSSSISAGWLMTLGLVLALLVLVAAGIYFLKKRVAEEPTPDVA